MAHIRLNPFAIIYHVIKNDAHLLEYDPHVQWKFHLGMTRYWAANFPIIIYLFLFQSKVWIAIALFINTIYSLYANLATDFGAVPASYAAMKAKEIQDKQDVAMHQSTTQHGEIIEAIGEASF